MISSIIKLGALPGLFYLIAAIGWAAAGGFASGCAAAGDLPFYFQSDAEKESPSSESVPVSQTTIDPGSTIRIQFNKPMALVDIGGNAANEGRWEWTDGRTELSISPVSLWQSNPVNITVSGTDKTGKTLSSTLYTFPVDDSQLAYSQDSPAADQMNLTTVFQFTFSRKMDLDTIQLSGSIFDGSGGAEWTGGNTVLTLAPSGQWADQAHTLSFSGNDVTGAAVLSGELNYTINTTVPTGSVDISSGSIISAGQKVRFTFDMTMDTGSVSLGGNLGDDDWVAAWSQTNVKDDTLSLSPNGSWSAGSNRTVTVNANSLAGNPVAEFSLSYTIIGRNIYVSSSTGNDSNPGTREEPTASIQTAITRAEVYTNETATRQIRVAAGTYSVDEATDGEAIKPLSNMEIKGGFNSDYSDRAWEVYTTTINDIDATAGSNMFQINLNISDVTIDGFTLNTSTASNGIFDRGINTTISNMVINGAGGNRCYDGYLSLAILDSITADDCGIWMVFSRGILRNSILHNAAFYSDTSQTQILNNRIGGVVIAGSPDSANAIWARMSQTHIENNLIYAGENRAIFFWSSCDDFCPEGLTTAVRNNIIVYNDIEAGYGIDVFDEDSGNEIIIENNIIHRLNIVNAGDGCIKTNRTAANITAIRNNVFSGCGSSLYQHSGGLDGDISSLETSRPTFSGNVITDVSALFPDLDGADNDPQTMNDNEWDLTGSIPCNIRQGGYDARNDDFPPLLGNDISGLPRTLFADQSSGCSPSNGGTGFSIGAQEIDP